MAKDEARPVSQEEILKEAMRHYDALLAYAYAILRDWSMAEDVVQDAIVLVNKKWTEFKPDGSVFKWVRGMVKFTAWDVARKRQKETVCGNTELVQLVDQQLETHMDELSAARMQDRKDELLRCLDQLGDRARSIILAFYDDVHSAQKLGELTDMTPNAIRLFLSRSRQKLRDCMEGKLAVQGEP